MTVAQIQTWLNRTSVSGDCLLYQGALNNGYARSRKYIHRALYEAVYGEIKQRDRFNKLYVLDHLCRNRSCINIKHLELVTDAENVKRGINPNKTECKYGHSYENNTGRNSVSGHRYCLTCYRQYNTLYMRKRRQRGNSTDTSKDT